MPSLNPKGARSSILARLARRAREGEPVQCAGARGRYRLDAVVGAGAECCVFRGIELVRRRPVAVKVLLDLPGDAHARFEQERRCMQRLRHPNIMVALDDGEVDGHPFYVMDYAARGSLGGWLQRSGPLPAPAAVGYLLEVLDALGYAHENGVIHRDVKPDNILVDADDVARLVDFGVALCIDDLLVAGLSESGTPTVGTMAYLSPEQAEDAGAVGPAADVYGVGATAYALITGKDPMALMYTVSREAALCELPEVVAEVIDIATRPIAAERFADASAMALALADALDAL